MNRRMIVRGVRPNPSPKGLSDISDTYTRPNFDDSDRFGQFGQPGGRVSAGLEGARGA
jgi:hypothetical protein